MSPDLINDSIDNYLEEIKDTEEFKEIMIKAVERHLEKFKLREFIKVYKEERG